MRERECGPPLADQAGGGATASRPVTGSGDPGLSGPWHVYLLECEDGTFYAGITKDVVARFISHATGRGAAYTRSHPPARVLASREYPSMGAALRAEYALKRLPRRDKLSFFEASELWPPDEEVNIPSPPGPGQA